MQDKDVLNIKIDHSKPLELRRFTISMLCVEKQYKKYLKQKNIINNGNYDLYINEIKQGSIDIYLIKKVIGLLEHYVYADFINWFKKKILLIFNQEIIDLVDQRIDLQDLKDIKGYVGAITNDTNSNINITSVKGDVITNNFFQTAPEAIAVEKQCDLLLDTAEKQTGIKEGVVLHWKQASDHEKTTSIDKGIIEELHDKKLKIICLNDNLKQEMVLEEGTNPFSMIYIVDVSIKTVEEKPVAYVIHKVHKKWEATE